MSIASRIQEMETHIGNAYTSIESLGIDISSINKNIYNISTLLDTFYESLPKVNGKGSNLSLSPTKVGKIKLNGLYGQTNQASQPSPSSPVPIECVTGLQNVTISNSDSSSSNTYEVNLGNIELNTIGDYEDSIKKSTGKNLFDKTDSIVNGQTFNSSGNLLTASDFFYQSSYISVKPNTTYSISGSKVSGSDSLRICEYTNDKTFIKRNYEQYTITTSADTYFIRVSNYKTLLDSIMINEGSTALPYEPYGKVWYVEKQTYSQIIGNVSTTNARTRSNTSTTHTKFYIISGLDYACATNLSIISDYYPTSSGANDGSYSNDAICSNVGNYNRHVYFSIPNEIASTIEQFISYINSTGIKVVYQLATPIYEVITNTELIEQLETLYNAKSKNGTTNITITSQDLPMLMDVSVIKGE